MVGTNTCYGNMFGGRTVICRKCKQPGHYARGCASGRIHESNTVTDNQISQNQPTQTVPINGVTNCYLCVLVLGESVSFLVGIGAGVSLINGKVWDRMAPKNINTKVAEFHNLVGVDSHPIKVRGSASLPMLVAETEFLQKFIIADGITTEGILGMDFMEEW